MIARIRNRVTRSPVFSFFLLAFGLSWSIGFLLIANYNSLISMPPALHYLASFGPALAAIVVTWLTGGREGLVGLASRIVKTNIGLRWLMVACLSPLALAAIAVLLNYLFTSALPHIPSLGHVEYLGDIGFLGALLLWIATFGFGEEIGWRGFALHTMQQRKWNSLPAAALIGVFWALWHLPAFFYKPALVELGIGGFAGFSLGVVSGSVLLAWLYNRSGGSVFAVAMWHALFDFVVASQAGAGSVAAITSVIVVVWAGLIAAADIWRLCVSVPYQAVSPLLR